MRKTIIGIGVTTIIVGFVFYLQGKSVIGPHTSFMYSNPQWIDNGLYIIAMGFVILILGICWFLKVRHIH